MPTTVSVIIAAKDSHDTIVRAIHSALSQPEVVQVVVVDDGSSDATAETARKADDGSGRVEVMVLARNQGPAFARNRALEVCRGTLVAILDADDFLLTGRFARLLAHDDWDMIADNIAFVPSGHDGEFVTGLPDVPSQLSLEDFVRGNISKGVWRGELGFLKPVIRREFLMKHGLNYNEFLRLGEDYDLYARMLAAGARFKIIRTLGYGAVVRPNSLSGHHRTEDLRRFADADHALLAFTHLSDTERDAITRHESQTRNRFRLRHYLDMKREHGVAVTVARLLTDPVSWWPVTIGILKDKLNPPPVQPAATSVRYLFPLV